MAIDRTSDRSSTTSQSSHASRAEATRPPEPPKVEARRPIDQTRSTFKAASTTPVALSGTVSAATETVARDVAEYRAYQGTPNEPLADARLAEKLAARKDDPRYGADVVGQLSPVELNRVYAAAKPEERGAVVDAMRAGVAQGTLSARDLDRASRLGARTASGLDQALAGVDPAATAEVRAATAALDTARATLTAAETRFAEHLAVGADLATDAQKAAAIAAFREQNAGLYEDVAKAEDALKASLEANPRALSETTLVEGYARLAETRHAEAALNWASERARTNGPTEALEEVVAAALPTVAATAAAAGEVDAQSFRAQLEAKLAPFMDPALAVAGAASTAWDYKGKAEALTAALRGFTALATGTAKPDDLEQLGKDWNESSRLGKALAVAGLAYDLYGAATAETSQARIEALIAASGDAATIIGGLAQAGRLGSEVLGVSTKAIGQYASRFLPGLGAVTSLASAWGRYAQDGFTVGSSVGILGDLVSAAGSAITATGVGALPGQTITAVGTGVSLVGDGITAVTNDRQTQAEREALWRAANERLPADQRIGEETMGYLRGGLFNGQTWRDGGTGALPDLPPELLQRAIEGGHLDALRDLEDELAEQVLYEVLPNRGSMSPGDILAFDQANEARIWGTVQERFEAQAPALLERLEGR
ncbi:MAG: hypothetical protein MUC96_12260 [Myxococcaceae bacterium]|nr:hypothetical protein [Myxococcaceae bacterium]